MSSEDKVADVGNRNYIDVLPTEVLCMIFDQLSFKDAKTASLVCQRWSGIISSRRFVFNIVSGFTQENEKPITEFGKVIGQSKRCYQRLRWIICSLNGSPQEVRLVWNAIHPKITSNLHLLELYGLHRGVARVFPEIAEQLPLMMQLKSLTLNLSGCYDSLDYPIILRSDSVNHLKAISTFKIRAVMPKLQTFEGDLSSLYRPEFPYINENLSSLTLTDLKNLIVDNFITFDLDKISKIAAQSVFQRLSNIETIEWVSEIEDEIFNVLCDTCTSLRELTIGPIGTGRKYYRSITCFDLTKLTNLTKLELGNTYIDFVQLPKSIRKLKINLYHPQMIQTLTDSSNSLEELQVVFCESYEETVSLLENLSVLQRLEVLVFYGGRFEKSSFLHMNAPLERVRQLRFVGCKLSTKRFLGIQEKFPNLKGPQFTSC